MARKNENGTDPTDICIQAKNAEEFLDILSPTKNDWFDTETSLNHWFDTETSLNHWIYRGHSDENYKLIPSLYRENEYLKIYKNISKKLSIDIYPSFNEHAIKNSISSSHELIQKKSNTKFKKRMENILKATIVELFLVDKFLESANNIGLKIPTLKLFLKQLSEQYAVDFFYNNIKEYILNFYFGDGGRNTLYENYFDPQKIFTLDRYKYKKFISHDFREAISLSSHFPEAIALARHHGIATRYLDWTTDPYIAAFFAANSNKSSTSKKNLTVCCLNTKYISDVIGMGYIQYHKKLPYAGLEYLHKQNGLFTEMIGIESFYFKNGHWPTLDDYLQETYLKSDDTPYPQKDYFKIIKISKKFSDEILSRIETMNIHKPSLMPNYDNVAEFVNNGYL